MKTQFFSQRCEPREFEDIVQDGLAVTPAQMLELTNKGFSVTAQNLRMLDSVDPVDKDFYVPMQYRRGVDLADLSVYSAELRDKMRKAKKDFDDGKIEPLTKGV